MKKFIAVLFLLVSLVFFAAGCGDEKIESTEAKSMEESQSHEVAEDDMSVYTGYKGPVQGEIKYCEGTPADANSQEYQASGDIGSPYHVNLIVTKNFGGEKMYSENVGLVRDEVGMEVMFRNLDIVTAYGGGFVNSINGLESQYTFFSGDERKKLDWFYWVNGILAPVGVAEYRPQPGDEIRWDYHNWGMTMFIPSIIGSYPQPFKSGAFGANPGTAVLYCDGREDDAKALKKSLNDVGVQDVEILEYDSTLLDEPEKFMILLGTWEELMNYDLEDKENYLYDINRKSKLIGVYGQFRDGRLNYMDFKGNIIKAYDEAGIIYSFSSGMGATIPSWIVSGTDEAGYKMALDTIVNTPEKFDNYFGALIADGEVLPVPYITEEGLE